MNETLIWLGILFCVTQSAMFSGLNLAFFSLTRLRLEIEVETSKSKKGQKVLEMRKDSNFLLTTILWGNVGINVLLTLLSDSVMAGVVSFAFSTVIITFFGEIIPQAYFSRNALRMASFLAPVLRFYQFLLYPVAKPTAMMLDSWLGKEAKQFLSEEYIKLFIHKHVEDETSEINKIEGVGAINFLSIDEIHISEEGEEVAAHSIIHLPVNNGMPVFPKYKMKSNDPFIRQINRSGKKWVIFADESDHPILVLDADGFIRSVYSEEIDHDILHYAHKPILIKREHMNLGQLFQRFRNGHHKSADKPIDRDIALFWSKDKKRIITGADLLGRLLVGI